MSDSKNALAADISVITPDSEPCRRVGLALYECGHMRMFAFCMTGVANLGEAARALNYAFDYMVEKRDIHPKTRVIMLVRHAAHKTLTVGAAEVKNHLFLLNMEQDQVGEAIDTYLWAYRAHVPILPVMMLAKLYAESTSITQLTGIEGLAARTTEKNLEVLGAMAEKEFEAEVYNLTRGERKAPNVGPALVPRA